MFFSLSVFQFYTKQALDSSVEGLVMSGMKVYILVGYESLHF